MGVNYLFEIDKNFLGIFSSSCNAVLTIINQSPNVFLKGSIILGFKRKYTNTMNVEILHARNIQDAPELTKEPDSAKHIR